jgi:uncharacterized protein (DUF1800 family)
MQHDRGTATDFAVAIQIDEGELPADLPSRESARFDGALLRLLAAATTTLAVAPSLASTTFPLPAASELMDWAQEAFPAFFPAHAADKIDGPYIYRYYPATGNYVGVAGTDVYILGPVSEGYLLKVGTLGDFAPYIYGDPRAIDAAAAAAARALLQAQFSANLTEIAEVRSLGFTAWLDARLSAPHSITGVAWLDDKGYDSTARSKQFYVVDTPAQWMLWNKLWTAPDAVRTRIALALSEFFVISSTGFNGLYPSYSVASFWDTLVRNAFGNVRQLLEEVSMTSAMGQFLSIIGSRGADGSGRQPDENYAREVMQLFTIGLYELNIDGTPKLDANGTPIETYSNEDVSQLAKVFTGYTFAEPSAPPVESDDPLRPTVTHKSLVTNPMRLIARNHSYEQVNFLGQLIPIGTDANAALKQALGILFMHPNVGPFFGRQMIQRLVTSNPSPAYVARVAEVFNNNGQGVRGDLKAVFRAILLDIEARAPATTEEARMGRLSEPMVRVAQFGRSFARTATLDQWKGFADTYGQQLPLRGPSVFNFFRPGYIPPGTVLAARGQVAPEFQIVGETTVATYLNHIQSLARNGFPANNSDDVFNTESGRFVGTSTTPVVPDYDDELPLVTNAALLVRHLNLVLCAGRLSAELQRVIIDALNATAVTADSPPSQKLNRISAAVLMVMAAPEYLVQR